MPEIKQDIRGATFVVAADDSLHKNMANYVCSGAADEVEILLAINALPATGGEVVLLDGTYNVAASIAVARSNFTLRGMGRGTIITTAVDNVDILTCVGGAGTELTNIILRDFLVRGFTAGIGNDIGILWDYVDQSKIINVRSELNTEHGFKLLRCDNDQLEGISGLSNVGYGMEIDSCTWLTITNPIMNSNTGRGFVLVSTTNISLLGLVCKSNGVSGLELNNANNTVIENAQCDANAINGLFLYRCSRCSIIGGQFNNQTGGDGINITGDGGGNADYNVIMGCVCTGNSQSGIEIVAAAGQANKNIVVGNHLLGNTGVNLADAGTNTEVAHNITA